MSDGETTVDLGDFPEYNEVDAREAEAALPAGSYDPAAVVDDGEVSE